MSEIQLDRPPYIVVGVDGSESSKKALRWASHLAAGAGASIAAVAAWEYPISFGWSSYPTAWSPAQDADKILTETIDEVFGADRPTDLRLAVHEGGAAKVLIDASSGAMMLVVGSRGHGGFAGVLLGSVSAAVAEHAKCPVLVVHGDTMPAPLAAPATHATPPVPVQPA